MSSAVNRTSPVLIEGVAAWEKTRSRYCCHGGSRRATVTEGVESRRRCRCNACLQCICAEFFDSGYGGLACSFRLQQRRRQASSSASLHVVLRFPPRPPQARGRREMTAAASPVCPLLQHLRYVRYLSRLPGSGRVSTPAGKRRVFITNVLLAHSTASVHASRWGRERPLVDQG